MNIGCVKEVKNQENRVGLTPGAAMEYVKEGHSVFIESRAGLGSGYEDFQYQEVGCTIVTNAKDVWNIADMLVKVKEPIKEEYTYFREDLILFTYLHLADNRELTHALCKAKMCAIAYETIEDKNGKLPLLKPMSQIAGTLSVTQGAKYLEKTFGGKGKLLSGVAGVKPGKVVIIGAGEVGMQAMKAAIGTHARVSILDKDVDRLSTINNLYPGLVNTIYSDDYSIQNEIIDADIIIGSVLIPGDKAPKLIREEHLDIMEPGTVLVDVAIDQGGCFESSHPTTHDNPIYVYKDIIHYAVSNIPGAVPKTATAALNNATLAIGLDIAKRGVEGIEKLPEHLYKGINVMNGKIINKSVKRAIEGNI